MKELYFDWWVKVVPASPLGRRDYPNLGMCGGSVSLNPYLSLDSIGSFEGKQAVNQTCFTVCLFFFPLGTMDLLLSRTWDEYSLKVFLFPASRDDTHRLSVAPHSCIFIVSLVQDAWQPSQTRLRTTGPAGELLLLASCIKFFVRLQW